MKFAYADPPYPGQARKHYDCEEINHEILINSLSIHYPDGWALSTSSSALKEILEFCPNDVRIASWVKPFCSFKPGVNPAYSWEPVIFRGGRSLPRDEDTVKDHLICNITMKKGLVGAKPWKFCLWILDLLGYQKGDTLDDLFPGTSTMRKAIEHRNNQTNINSVITLAPDYEGGVYQTPPKNIII